MGLCLRFYYLIIGMNCRKKVKWWVKKFLYAIAKKV